jgi:hypothetical protein
MRRRKDGGLRLDRVIDRFLYGGKGRGPIGKPVRILAGGVGLLLFVFGMAGTFTGDPEAVTAGAIVAGIGFLLVMLGLKAGPAPPGSRRIELAKYRRAQRAQNLCFGIGFVGLVALKVAAANHLPGLVPWLPPEGHLLTIIFWGFWIGGFVCNVFANYYLAQERDLGGHQG